MLKRMAQASLALLLSSTLLLSGCLGITQPTDEQIIEMSTEFFKETLNQENPSLFQAHSVTKTNGYKQNDTHYVVEITIAAEAKQSLKDYVNTMANDPSLNVLEKMTLSMQAGMMGMSLNSFQAGDRVKFEKQYLFIKTDNGWMLKKDLTEEG